MLLTKESGLWQQVWVNRERRKLESMLQQQGCIEEVTEVSMGLEMMPVAGKLRQLRLKEMKTHTQTPLVGALTIGSLQLSVRLGEVQAYVAQESEDGVIQGWVEAKRKAEDLEDSITVAVKDAMRKSQARELSYPRAGGRSETPEDEEMIVEVSPEPAGTIQNSLKPQNDENESENNRSQRRLERRGRKGCSRGGSCQLTCKRKCSQRGWSTSS